LFSPTRPRILDIGMALSTELRRGWSTATMAACRNPQTSEKHVRRLSVVSRYNGHGDGEPSGSVPSSCHRHFCRHTRQAPAPAYI
jgi:hypothetical protein